MRGQWETETVAGALSNFVKWGCCSLLVDCEVGVNTNIFAL
jgi:hypothetical protein